MKSYYSRIFKKSKIRRKATLSALDLGEKFNVSALNNSRIISKLSEYSAWKARDDDNDRDMSALEEALAKDFMALVNQNILLSQREGELNDLHAQYQQRIIHLEEQVRIFSREKANIMEEYRVLDSNYKFLSLKNEQFSNYCANLQDQLCQNSNGQIDLKEFRKSKELEFICLKLQKKLDDLERENSWLKASIVDEKGWEPSVTEPVNPSVKIFALRDLSKKNLIADTNVAFQVPKVEDDRYIPQNSFGTDSVDSDRIEAAVQTDMGFDILKLEHAYSRLKKKNAELIKRMQRYEGKVQKDSQEMPPEGVGKISELTSEISLLGLKPHTISRKEVGVNQNMEVKDSAIKTASIASDQTEVKNLDQTLHKDIQYLDADVIKAKDEYRILEEALKTKEQTLKIEIEKREKELIYVRHAYQNMERALKLEIEHRDQDLTTVRHEYQELNKLCHESKLENDVLKKQVELDKENTISLNAEKEALENRLDCLLVEISKLKQEQNSGLKNSGTAEANEEWPNGSADSNKLIESLRNEITTLQEIHGRKSAECDQLTQMLMEVRQEYQELSLLFDESSLKRDDLTRELSKIRSQLDKANTQNATLSKEICDLEFVQQKREIEKSSHENDLLLLKNENDESKKMVVALKIETYKENFGEILTKKDSLQEQIKNTDELLSTVRHEYQGMFNSHDVLNLKNMELSKSLSNLKTKLDAVKDENKRLSAENDGFRKLISASQEQISSLRQTIEDLKITPDQYVQLQTECVASKDTIAALENEITKYRLDMENRAAELQEFAEKKGNLLKEIAFLDREVVNRDHLVADMRIEKDKLQSDLEAQQTRILSVQEETQLVKSEYLKLCKKHEEAIKLSSEKDQRIKETFSAFVRISNQLKYEQSQRAEIEKKLSDELKVALERNNDRIDNRPSEEMITLQNELKESEEKLFSLGIKYGQLETEMERRELEYKEEIAEADSNLEALLEKYDDLSKKAVMLETLYKKTQSDFYETRRVIS